MVKLNKNQNLAKNKYIYILTKVNEHLSNLEPQDNSTFFERESYVPFDKSKNKSRR
jgi:hypothetical protein